jgi:uncharacterized protein (DUF305 family)
MKSILKTTIPLSVLLAAIAGCNNSTSETSASGNDSATSQSSNSANDTSSMKDDMSSMSMNNGMMTTMTSTMDRMKNIKMTGDFDVDFANMMIEHHQAGIDMAQAEISQGKDEKMKSKAQEIINKQKDEQQKLKDFVSNYKPSGMKHGEGELQKSMSENMDKMKSMQMSGDTDKDFAMVMSTHHEHGVSMSKMELTYGMSDKLKQMARKSIDDQQKDIAELKSLMNNK